MEGTSETAFPPPPRWRLHPLSFDQSTQAACAARRRSQAAGSSPPGAGEGLPGWEASTSPEGSCIPACFPARTPSDPAARIAARLNATSSSIPSDLTAWQGARKAVSRAEAALAALAALLPYVCSPAERSVRPTGAAVKS
jgi:hypothetical protein